METYNHYDNLFYYTDLVVLFKTLYNSQVGFDRPHLDPFCL